MLGKRSRFRKTTSMSQLSKPSFTLPENGARESSPESAHKGPLHQSDYSLGAPQFGFRREVFTDAPYKAGIFQNGPAMMAIEGASFAEQESCIQGAVCKTNHSLHCPSPLASPSNSSLLAPLAFGCARPQEALSEPSGTQMVAAGESQLTEWHRNTRSSVSLGVSFASVDGPHTLQTVSPASFLDACFLCKKRLGPRVDIFMYRGDTAFCSDECRDRQMDIDERRERASLASGKKATDVPNTVHHTNQNQAPTDTAAAVA